MTLEIDKTYTQKELAEAIGIKPNTFSKNKEKYLNNLALYYEYEIENKGLYNFYTIKRQIGEYQKPKRKNDISKSKQFVHDEIMDVAKKTSLFSYKGVQRFIESENRQGNMSSSYLYERIRIEGNEMFGTKVGDEGTEGKITDRVWCRLVDGINLYEPISDKLINEYRKIVKQKNKEYTEDKENLFEDYSNGLISKEEYEGIVATMFTSVFIEAKLEFELKYGFQPRKIPKRELKAWKG